MQTPCKNCCFAQYEDNTQVGCDMGRLEVFAQNGATIIKAYDDEKEFDIVSGRLCNAFRTQEWAAESTQGTIGRVIDEIWFQPEFVIYANEYCTQEDILRTLCSCMNCLGEPKVGKITVILNHCNIDTRQIMAELSKWPPGWTIETMIAENYKFVQCLNLISSKIKTAYYAVIAAGDLFNLDIIYRLDEQLNDYLRQFVLVRSDNSHCFIIQTNLHKICDMQEILYGEETEELAALTLQEDLIYVAT